MERSVLFAEEYRTYASGHWPRLPYARGRWTPPNFTEGLLQQMLEYQDAHTSNKTSELSQEDWDFLLRLQVDA